MRDLQRFRFNFLEEVYVLAPGEIYIVGREGANIRTKDGSVSRKHAEVSRNANGPGATIKDLGSKYGTYVGEEAIKSSNQKSQEDCLTPGENGILLPGQPVRFGLCKFRFKWEQMSKQSKL